MVGVLSLLWLGALSKAYDYGILSVDRVTGTMGPCGSTICFGEGNLSGSPKRSYSRTEDSAPFLTLPSLSS
jgi:hypothetical protein